jgi:V8-like Glu-specific endopeptidase
MLRLTVLSGARAGARVELAQPVIRIGRAPDNDLAFDPNVDLDASAHHAEIREANGAWVLVDVGSRNGIFLPLDGMRRVQQHQLAPQDQFQLGPQGPRVQVEVMYAQQQPAYAPPAQYQAPQQAYPQQYAAPQQAVNPFAEAAAAPPPIPPMQPPQAPQGQGGAPKMGQQTLLAHVGAMLQQQKRGKSTIEIKAMVEKETKRATGRLKAIIGLLVFVVLASAGGIVLLAMRTPEDPGALRKELEKLAMNDPKRKELEKKLAGLAGQDGNVGRKIYEDNRNALFMLVAHHGKNYEKGGFCTAFAIRPRVLASNAHCVKAAEDFEDKGADIWVHLNESNKGSGDPKMYKVASHAGHPKYKHHGMSITPDVGLFVLEDDDAKIMVNVGEKGALKKLGTGDSLYVIGFPGRTMDEASPVAVFMFSHVGRITDALGQRAESFEDGWLVQHEGQTTPGTSGSPIFNSEGKVVAINAGGLLESNKQSVYKYAMRIDLVDDIDIEESAPKKKKKNKPASDDDD